MGLSFRNRELEKLARLLAERTGKSMTEEISIALKERMKRIDTGVARRDRLNLICTRCSTLPDMDTRGVDNILGYDGDGFFNNGG